MRRSAGIRFGKGPLAPPSGPASGRFTDAFGERFYVIDDAQAMRPFLMSLVSSDDHWVFVSSSGGLTAGRRNPKLALFPYVTDDKLFDACGVTGPVTSLVVERGKERSLWHPFRPDDLLAYRVTRRLYKNALGSRVVFEETNHDLAVTFRYAWSTSAEFGFVRDSAVVNDARSVVTVTVLDGLLNLLPANVEEPLQLGFSCLLDAYKTNELLPGSTLAVYALAAQPVDRAEPCESLRATTVWSEGLPDASVHLSAERLGSFDAGQAAAAAPLVRGKRGAYLVEGRCRLGARAERSWRIVADVDRSQREVTALRRALSKPARLVERLTADVAAGERRLLEIAAASDGLQHTADELATSHHLANVLFNDLRGGVYASGYEIAARDFAAHVQSSNVLTWRRHRAFLEALPERVERATLLAAITERGDADLERHAYEYLPLTFSRRHGDPSRPWNRFDIRVRDEHGAPRLHFEGNWRDIFQNWEALTLSYPEFVEHLIAKFVNASTVDGHNAYRLSRDGIDWEVPEADAAWSTIGYWGDHQIIYLLKLLESSLDHHPLRLRGLLTRDVFTYANVPYEILPLADIFANPRTTIRFDHARDAEVRERAAKLGSDGKLLHAGEEVVRVNLVEKLLVAALAKLSNFVAGGGIWLNTQRPEWNDANNALVGYGVSMVTLCYLERYLAFLPRLLGPLRGERAQLSTQVHGWLTQCARALHDHRALLASDAIDDRVRGRLLRALGQAASDYRGVAYARGLSGKKSVTVDEVLAFAAEASDFLSHTIRLARRPDGLFHSYNVLVPHERGAVGIEPLYEMLEGQVAVLSAPALDAGGACEVLDALPRSRMYRADQRSYMLYPDRGLPGFLEKNVIPAREAKADPLLSSLASDPRPTVVVRDADGKLRFHADLANGARCREALVRLRETSRPKLKDAEIARVLALYERVFHHRAFTGRSGTMFAYEGLGSIYWHMVGKLLVAAQEQLAAAVDAGADARVRRKLASHCLEIRTGLAGVNKSPAVYGAFPADPYSHTPAGGGARQPGMTGQVKEEILTRFGELGVRVRDGRITFRPILLSASELHDRPTSFRPIAVDGSRSELRLPARTLAFTYCQVPVVYHQSPERRLRVTVRGGVIEQDGGTLDATLSASVFGRAGDVQRIDVFTPIAAARP